MSAPSFPSKCNLDRPKVAAAWSTAWGLLGNQSWHKGPSLVDAMVAAGVAPGTAGSLLREALAAGLLEREYRLPEHCPTCGHGAGRRVWWRRAAGR